MLGCTRGESPIGIPCYMNKQVYRILEKLIKEQSNQGLICKRRVIRTDKKMKKKMTTLLFLLLLKNDISITLTCTN